MRKYQTAAEVLGFLLLAAAAGLVALPAGLAVLGLGLVLIGNARWPR